MSADERARDVVRALELVGDRSRLEGMARFGIDTTRAVGVTVTELRRFARDLGHDHELAVALWASGVHEARLLASLVDEPAMVSEAQMEAWVADLDSWDVCDGVCGNLFDRTPFALDKAVEWSTREPEFEKRAAFALMASAAVHRKDLPDAEFASLLPVIRAQAIDERNYVKKAVSWALRQIGKRSPRLNSQAVRTAEQIERIDSRAARWVARDALRELQSDAVQARLRKS
ncbi:MAG TPA: DNA alkylation repair protein [Actinomycetota bacterium]